MPPGLGAGRSCKEVQNVAEEMLKDDICEIRYRKTNLTTITACIFCGKFNVNSFKLNLKILIILRSVLCRFNAF